MLKIIETRADEIKVIRVGKIPSCKPAIRENELKLLEGFDKIDYTKRRDKNV